jgi:replicative DNA helicase
VVTISDTLKLKNEQLIDIGGMSWLAYLGMLAKDTPSAANIVAYANIVREHSILRETLDICNNTRNRVFSNEKSVDILKDFIEKSSALLSGFTNKTNGLVHIKEVLGRVIDKTQELFESNGITDDLITPWSALNEKIGGFPKGVTYIGGRPGSGKSTIAQNEVQLFATKEEFADKYAVVFSIEMSPELFVLRLISSIARIELGKLKSGRLEEEDWTRFSNAVTRLIASKIFIDGTKNLSVADYNSKLK